MRKILIFILEFISKLTIKRFNPKIIAVTGSAGKTSSKEAIYSILKNSNKSTRKSYGNFNNEIGVPLTILGSWKRIYKPIFIFWPFVIVKGVFNLFLPKKFYPNILVLEYGADKPNDINKLIKIAHPNISVITSIGDIPVHIEFYPSGVEYVAKEKSKLITNLSVSDFAVLNIDDKRIKKMKDKTRAKIITFGFSSDSDIKISNFSHIISDGKIKGIVFKIEESGNIFPIVVNNAFSIGQAYAVASAMCVAKALNMNLIESASIITKNYIPFKGRSVIYSGVMNTQIIDESYNSSPIALELSLLTLSLLSDFRRIGVIGDMLELGKYTVRAHKEIGKFIYKSLDILIAVGNNAKIIASEALKSGMNKNSVYSFDTAEESLVKLKEIMENGDLIFVKGSRKIGLEYVVKSIKRK